MLVIWEILKGIKYFNAAGKDSFHLCDRNPIVCDWEDVYKRQFYHHQEFHRKMTEAVINCLGEEELPVLLKTLDKLSEFFREYPIEQGEKKE